MKAPLLLLGGLALACRCHPGDDTGSDSTEPVDSAVDDGSLDPLSMPATPTLDPADFALAESCTACHPDQVAQWRQSMHAYAMVDPVYQSLVAVRQADLDGAEDPFCLQCHSAIATRGGEVVPGFSFDDLSPISMEGVTCTACHSVSSVARVYNSGHVLDGGGPMRGPITDPMESSAHAMEPTSLLGEATFCGACHDANELFGLPLERPWSEWSDSPAAAESRPCQSCHAPEWEGQAAVGGPVRPGLHAHRFVGVDRPLKEGWMSEEDQADLLVRVEALLTSAGSIRLDLPASVGAGATLDLVVTVTNDIDAHNLPTGSTFLRQCWLEVTVDDALGNRLYETGTLDEGGDLRDHWSLTDPYGDPDLVSFSSRFLDADGQPTLFTHIAREHRTDALDPLDSKTVTLFVPTSEAVEGPLSVRARLRFRSLPPHLFQRLPIDASAEDLRIYDIDAAEGEVALR